MKDELKALNDTTQNKISADDSFSTKGISKSSDNQIGVILTMYRNTKTSVENTFV